MVYFLKQSFPNIQEVCFLLLSLSFQNVMLYNSFLIISTSDFDTEVRVCRVGAVVPRAERKAGGGAAGGGGAGAAGDGGGRAGHGLEGAGPASLDRGNLTGLVLGCIDAKFCK